MCAGKFLYRSDKYLDRICRCICSGKKFRNDLYIIFVYRVGLKGCCIERRAGGGKLYQTDKLYTEFDIGSRIGVSTREYEDVNGCSSGNEGGKGSRKTLLESTACIVGDNQLLID